MITKIKQEKIKAIKEKDEDMKMACNMILGEIPRLNKKEIDVTNSEFIQIINKLIKSELVTLGYSGQDENDYIKCLKSFLPKQKSKEELIEWINKNIEFSKLKNKMQAISIVKKEFGDSVDGNMVKNIIEKGF